MQPRQGLRLASTPLHPSRPIASGAPPNKSSPQLTDVLETLARLPPPQEILTLRPSPALQDCISTLLEKLKNGGLSADEEREWQDYQYIEHLVRITKAKAALQLKPSDAP